MINSEVQKQIDYIKDRCKDIKPLVVIRSITYNHEPYLKDALEGFVMQNANFPFVAIVHDDASTDGTAKVLREYAEKYPDIIFPIFEEENQYSKRDGSLSKIMNEASFATGAKYVAICEGDDYWTEPNKLQKQIDFLESHPDFSLCFHNVNVKDVNSVISNGVSTISRTGQYFPEEIIRHWVIPTASVIIRNTKKIFENPLRYNPNFKFGDNVLFLTASIHGKMYGFADIMGVYRKIPTGATIKDGYYKWNQTNIVHYRGLKKNFKSIVKTKVFNEVISEFYLYLIRYNKGHKIKLLKTFLQGFRDARVSFLILLYKTWFKIK